MPGVLNEPTNSGELRVPTLEEALALAVAMCPANEYFTIHEAHCAVSAEHPDRCTCSPQIIAPAGRGRA